MHLWIQCMIPQRGGLPHSDIHGSKPARGSPWLFAACHVLHRLLVPRHPPNALLLLENTHPQAMCPRTLAQGLHHARKPSTENPTPPAQTRSAHHPSDQHPQHQASLRSRLTADLSLSTYPTRQPHPHPRPSPAPKDKEQPRRQRTRQIGPTPLNTRHADAGGPYASRTQHTRSDTRLRSGTNPHQTPQPFGHDPRHKPVSRAQRRTRT